MNKEHTMQRLSLLLILGMAAGCDAWTSQPYTQGCNPLPDSSVLGAPDNVIDIVRDGAGDPTFGQCIGRAVPGGGTDPGGTGGTGGTECPPPPDFPPIMEPSNFGTCGSEADPCNENCDYGCTAVNNTFGFVAVLAANPDESLSGGSTTDTTFSGYFVVSEAFIQGASEVFGPLNEAVVPPGAVVPLTALQGATGPDLTLTLEAQTIDLTEDPDGNGVPGPFFLPFVPGTATYTYGASGEEACFNLTDGIDFIFQVTDPLPITANFLCQPTDQELINQDSVMCMDSDACLAPSTCVSGECTSEIVPDPEAGEVCFTIPGAGGGTGGVGGGGSG